MFNFFKRSKSRLDCSNQSQPIKPTTNTLLQNQDVTIKNSNNPKLANTNSVDHSVCVEHETTNKHKNKASRFIDIMAKGRNRNRNKQKNNQQQKNDNKLIQKNNFINNKSDLNDENSNQRNNTNKTDDVNVGCIENNFENENQREVDLKTNYVKNVNVVLHEKICNENENSEVKQENGCCDEADFVKQLVLAKYKRPRTPNIIPATVEFKEIYQSENLKKIDEMGQPNSKTQNQSKIILPAESIALPVEEFLPVEENEIFYEAATDPEHDIKFSLNENLQENEQNFSETVDEISLNQVPIMCEDILLNENSEYLNFIKNNENIENLIFNENSDDSEDSQNVLNSEQNSDDTQNNLLILDSENSEESEEISEEIIPITENDLSEECELSVEKEESEEIEDVSEEEESEEESEDESESELENEENLDGIKKVRFNKYCEEQEYDPSEDYCNFEDDDEDSGGVIDISSLNSENDDFIITSSDNAFNTNNNNKEENSINLSHDVIDLSHLICSADENEKDTDYLTVMNTENNRNSGHDGYYDKKSYYDQETISLPDVVESTSPVVEHYVDPDDKMAQIKEKEIYVDKINAEM